MAFQELGAGISGKLEPFFIRIIISSTISLAPRTSFGKKVHQFPVAVVTNNYHKNSRKPEKCMIDAMSVGQW